VPHLSEGIDQRVDISIACRLAIRAGGSPPCRSAWNCGIWAENSTGAIRCIDEGLLSSDVTPSYFLEGMLYNVPNDKFTGTYTHMWVECFNWMVTTDRAKLTCAKWVRLAGAARQPYLLARR